MESRPARKPPKDRAPTAEAANNEPRQESRELADLKAHPLQATFFAPLPAEEVRVLADNIQKRGLKNPIEIMPANEAGLEANTILDGHERRRALELLGETRCTVIVRYDLATASATEVEEAFLEPNRVRRQLNPLAMARIAVRRLEIERRRPRGGLHHRDLAEARDRVGQALGISGRNLGRYLRILRTPHEVQMAFSAGRLPLTLAEKVADLGAMEQKAVARRIAEGEEPKAVLMEFIAKPKAGRRKVCDAMACFASGLRAGMEDLEGRVAEVGDGLARRHLGDLKKAKVLIAELIARAGA